MNNLVVAERFFNETARIEKIIYIAGNDFDSPSDDLRDFIEDIDSEELIERIFGATTDRVLNALRDDDEFSMELTEWLFRVGKLGLLLKFATPVMTPLKGGGGSFSWGYQQLQWVYGDTFEEALEKGFEWVEECRVKEKAQPAQENPHGDL